MLMVGKDLFRGEEKFEDANGNVTAEFKVSSYHFGGDASVSVQLHHDTMGIDLKSKEYVSTDKARKVTQQPHISLNGLTPEMAEKLGRLLLTAAERARQHKPEQAFVGETGAAVKVIKTKVLNSSEMPNYDTCKR